MSVILQPQSSFPIVRQIANHLDTDVLYVRAVVRNADGDTIDTVDLEDKGGQRFQRRYRVPVDSSGQGAYISIITSVYTDSGYTTKSPNYGDEENTYLVFDRVRGAGGGGGGGGSNLDAGTVRRIVAEELAKVEAPEVPEMPEIPRYEMRWQDVLESVDEVRSMVARIPTEKVNEAAIATQLNEVVQTVLNAIEDKEVTPETDLFPVVQAIDAAAVDMIQQIEGLRQFVAGSEEELKKTIVDTITDNMQNTEFVTDFQVRPKRKMQNNPQPAQPEYDVNKLAL